MKKFKLKKGFFLLLFFLSLVSPPISKTEGEDTDITGLWEVVASGSYKGFLKGKTVWDDSATETHIFIFEGNGSVIEADSVYEGKWIKKNDNIVIRWDKKDGERFIKDFASLLNLKINVINYQDNWKITEVSESTFAGEFTTLINLKIISVPAAVKKLKGKLLKIKSSGSIAGTKISGKSIAKELDAKERRVLSIAEEVIKNLLNQTY